MNKTNVLKSLETLSVVGFGIAYWKYDLNTATLTLMALMTLFVVAVKVAGEKLTKLQFFSWLVIVVLGGAGILFRDETFIKWKTTIINGSLGMTFLLSHLFGDKTITERLLADKIKAPTSILKRLNLSVGFYFLFISALNLVVAYYFSTTLWVKFKIFGLLILNFTFVAGALFYLKDYLKDFLDNEMKKR
jgi:intracellular septation protein